MLQEILWAGCKECRHTSMGKLARAHKWAGRGCRWASKSQGQARGACRLIGNGGLVGRCCGLGDL